MKCKYPPCPNDVPVTGKRPREYCSNAHKQADYRRRKMAEDSGTTASSLELSQALTRISTLEQMVAALEAKTSGLDRRLQELERQGGTEAEVHQPVEPARELAPSELESKKESH